MAAGECLHGGREPELGFGELELGLGFRFGLGEGEAQEEEDGMAVRREKERIIPLSLPLSPSHRSLPPLLFLFFNLFI